MPVKRIEPTTTSIVLGRHTRLAVTFQWRDQSSGELVGLEGFVARVWVADQEGNLIEGSPFPAVVGATKVTYQMSAADLAAASASSTSAVYFTCVAENGNTVLPPNKRAVVVGDWTGANTYTPAGG